MASYFWRYLRVLLWLWLGLGFLLGILGALHPDLGAWLRVTAETLAAEGTVSG